MILQVNHPQPLNGNKYTLRDIEEENMKFDLSEVLTRTWKIGWNHKVLWLWQMLPGLLTIVFMPILFLANPAFSMFTGGDPNIYFERPWMRFLFVGATLLLAIPSIFLNVLAQLTTTVGAVKVERGTEKFGFMDLFNEAKPYYWRVFGVYAVFIGGWTAVIVGLNIFLSIASIFTFGLAFLCFIPLFFLLIPVMVVGFSVLELTQNAVVVDDMRVFDAISHGWKLFKTNWLGVVIVLLLLYFAMYILSMFVTIPMMFPMMIMLMPMGLDPQSPSTLLTGIPFIAFFSLITMVTSIVQGILMTFFQTGWTALYLRINHADNSPVMAKTAQDPRIETL